MSVTSTPTRADLAALVDPAPVLVEAADCAPFSVDGKVPDCAVTPTTAEQVASVLQYAGEHQLAVIPRGSGSKLGTGNAATRYDVALLTQQLKRVVHYEPADLTTTVEAGMSFGEFQDRIGRDGLWLPLDPRGGREATVGGIIAANAAGPLRQGFGGPRDMVLGLKIATADGKVVKTGGRVVKNVAGYDLAKLLTGSFGTLGVIVEACVKLFPKPAERATFAMRSSTLGIARDLRRSILRSPIDPMRLVLLDAAAAALMEGSDKNQNRPEVELRVEVGGSHRVIERCMWELQQLATAVGAPLLRVEDAEDSWSQVADLARWLQPKYRDLTTLKAALPLAASEELMSRAQQEAEAERIALASFAHAGVGIVHLCMLQETLGPNIAGLIGRLRQAAGDLGGTLVVEHCPVELKGQIDVWAASGTDVETMRQMKSTWDAKGVLSPGRFVAGI